MEDDMFGYGGNINQNDDATNNKTQEDQKTDLNGDIEKKDLSDVQPDGNNTNPDPDDDKPKTDDKKHQFETGTVLEIGADKYTIDKDGNALDANGNIFKQANEISDWLKSFEQVDENSDVNIDIEKIKEIVGIDIKDENDKVVEFENTPEGIKSYIDAVLESKRNENYDVAINTFFQRYPIMEDVLDYYLSHGGSLEGFGERPDRSNIVIDENNEAQQIHIIKTAWTEKGIKGNVDNYIQYLRSSGTLYATAQEELQSLKQSDIEYKQKMAEEAERKENEYIAKLEEYWNNVHEIVKSRKIGNYQIPETILITRNGQKISATPEDFFNYIYRVDKDNKSDYQKDLEKESLESKREDDILRAYLKFVGGNYSNLVDMAINKQNVNTLKFKAAQRTTNKVRVNKPAQTKNKNIDLGYN